MRETQAKSMIGCSVNRNVRRLRGRRSSIENEILGDEQECSIGSRPENSYPAAHAFQNSCCHIVRPLLNYKLIQARGATGGLVQMHRLRVRQLIGASAPIVVGTQLAEVRVQRSAASRMSRPVTWPGLSGGMCLNVSTKAGPILGEMKNRTLGLAVTESQLRQNLL